MKIFYFANYLVALEQSESKETGERVNNQVIEINELRTHTAQLATMQKHLKHYKTLKYWVEKFGLNLG